MKEETCRHCGDHFIPSPNKPGYVDECPDCLNEQTAQMLRKKKAKETMVELRAMIERFANSENLTTEQVLERLRKNQN